MRIVELKAEIRAAVLAERDALDEGWRAQASAKLAGFDLPFEPRQGLLVSAFWPIRSEIDVRPLLERLAGAGCRLALPRIEQGDLVFRAWRLGEPLEDGGFGTKVPPLAAPVCDPDVMLTPLVAFDRRGARLGYGKGYYDGAIGRRAGRPPLTIGIAFSIQEVEAVPLEPHDRFLDYVLTEEGYAVSVGDKAGRATP